MIYQFLGREAAHDLKTEQSNIVHAVKPDQFALASGKVAFSPMQTYPVGVLNSGDASAGDGGGGSFLLGNGDGTFQPAENLALRKNYTSIVSGDFDGDGKDDLVLVRPGDPTAGDSGDVTIFLNNGDGTFRQG